MLRSQLNGNIAIERYLNPHKLLNLQFSWAAYMPITPIIYLSFVTTIIFILLFGQVAVVPLLGGGGIRGGLTHGMIIGACGGGTHILDILSPTGLPQS